MPEQIESDNQSNPGCLPVFYGWLTDFWFPHLFTNMTGNRARHWSEVYKFHRYYRQGLPNFGDKGGYEFQQKLKSDWGEICMWEDEEAGKIIPQNYYEIGCGHIPYSAAMIESYLLECEERGVAPEKIGVVLNDIVFGRSPHTKFHAIKLIHDAMNSHPAYKKALRDDQANLREYEAIEAMDFTEEKCERLLSLINSTGYIDLRVTDRKYGSDDVIDHFDKYNLVFANTANYIPAEQLGNKIQTDTRIKSVNFLNCSTKGYSDLFCSGNYEDGDSTTSKILYALADGSFKSVLSVSDYERYLEKSVNLGSSSIRPETPEEEQIIMNRRKPDYQGNIFYWPNNEEFSRLQTEEPFLVSPLGKMLLRVIEKLIGQY